MYDALVKRLRCLKYGSCPDCPMWYSEEVEPNLWRERCAAIDAAYAIEELSKRVPVPPHGRLIDADKMRESIRWQTGLLKFMGGELSEFAETLEKGFLKEIDNAPTVIEAEEGE